jgi:hypothetical protein
MSTIAAAALADQVLAKDHRDTPSNQMFKIWCAVPMHCNHAGRQLSPRNHQDFRTRRRHDLADCYRCYQQSSASEEINANIGQIAKITQETAAGSQESAKADHELSNLTDAPSHSG